MRPSARARARFACVVASPAKRSDSAEQTRVAVEPDPATRHGPYVAGALHTVGTSELLL
jgi:hypothetical protein